MEDVKENTCGVCDKEIEGEFTYWQCVEGWEGNEVGMPTKIHEGCKCMKKDGKIVAFLEGYEVFNYKNKGDL